MTLVNKRRVNDRQGYTYEMATPDALNCNIREPYLQAETKCAILNGLWDCHSTAEKLSRDCGISDVYFDYYREQCENILYTNNALINTHQDIIDIVFRLKVPSLIRQTIRNELLACLPNAEQNGSERFVGEAIDLAARLWLMIDIGPMLHGFVPGQRPLQWDKGSLHELIKNRFEPRHETDILPRVKLDKIFNARNLERIAGLKLVWTSNIADHLRMMNDDTRVAIFHHASVLNYQKDNPMFPPGFIGETLRTLSLLLPQHDKQSRQWFENHPKRSILDKNASTCEHLTTEERQIGNFVFWRERLLILKQVFDEAEPNTLGQWWRDRRRRVQWSTFWVAALVLFLTIFFGFIQCFEGGMQVYKAYYPSVPS